MTNLFRLFIFVIFLLLNGCATAPVGHDDALAQGYALFNQGRFAAALQAWQPLKNTHDSALLLRQARAYQGLGQIREALPVAEAALTYADADRQPEILLALGEIELMAGLKPQALQHLQQVRQSGVVDPRVAVQLAVVEGRLALLDKKPEQALVQFAHAESLAMRLGDALLQQEMAVSRWLVLYEMRTSSIQSKDEKLVSVFTNDELMALHDTVDAVFALPASASKDFVALKLARLLLNLYVETAAAGQLLSSAATTSRSREDYRLLSYALGYQGLWAEQQQHDRDALNFSAQAAFAAQQAGATESLYLWEWQSARIMQRLQRLDEALAAYRRAVFNLQRVRADLGSGRAFREKIAPLFIAFSDLLLKMARIEPDRDKAEKLLREVRDILELQKAAELQDYFQDRCVANFKAKTKSLEQISEHTAVLYPVLLPDRTEMLVSFADGLRQFVIPVDHERLVREIYDFRTKLEKRTTYQYLRSAKQLYQWLIVPLLADLRQHQIDTLVIVPDGALRSIPLAALHDGRHYLIEDFAVATTPGLALTDPHPLPKQHLAVLLNGLTESVQQFPALPDVDQELDSIHNQYGGKILKDNDFRLTALAQAMESTPYRIVHIASHGQFDRDPNKTFLLTYDTKLTMNLLERYISAGKFRAEPVELLTLSACQTAAGDDRAALGLAGVAIKAGARSALASLWFINDQASSQLVVEFYRQLQKHLSKAQALQQAQRELLTDPRYRHASYWAPFLMIGNWL